MNINPLGIYVTGDSVLHRLDPRIKLGLLICWTIALFCIGSWTGLALAALVFIGLALYAQVPLIRMARNIWPMFIVLAVIILANALRFDGSGTWEIVGSFGISDAGLVRGTKAVVRIILMVGLTLLVTSTTSVTALTESFLSIMGPLRHFHVPIDDIATMLSIAIRFIPVCAEQFDRVVLAQRARGAHIGQGGPIQRVTSWVPVMIPLFVGLFRRSDILADAMYARCYRGEGRTCLTTLRIRPRDIIIGICGLALCIAAAVVF